MKTPPNTEDDKYDLDLNKSSLTRALGDARAIVYGDAAAQYGMKKPGPIKKKRRKDADEEPSGGKKQKTSMKRVYKKGHCRYCGETGHTKRNCRMRTVDEELAAMAAVANADANEGEVNNSTPTATVNGGDAPTVSQDQVEIELELSQLIFSESDDSQQVKSLPVRPSKLPPKRKLSTPKKNSHPMCSSLFKSLTFQNRLNFVPPSILLTDF
ncbi:hypothetical protein Ahy_A10g049848 [Arachis hypogaea]|uniref:CCHC-type domain-containing protein n=1 Tax=Arachis hypogaea TaxID=3818 RepID=A0A445B815_ARAHY|nr:hypothetical protein Ahy_A10g049848 [Arachis hypogaea]